MLYLRLLMTLSALALLSCQTTNLPPPPPGNLCIFNSETMIAHCKPISQAGIKSAGNGAYYLDLSAWKRVSAGDTDVPASMMMNWLTTDPLSWSGIETYINELKLQCAK